MIDSCTDFHEFFEPLYPLIADYVWVSDDLRFAPPPEWDNGPYDPELDRYGSAEWSAFWAHLVAEEREPAWRAVWSPGFLGRYARFLSDDWCWVIGLRQSAPSGLLDATRGILWPEVINLIGAEIAFVNVDAAYWQVFSSRAEVLDTVRTHLAPRSDLHLVEVYSEESP